MIRDAVRVRCAPARHPQALSRRVGRWIVVVALAAGTAVPALPSYAGLLGGALGGALVGGLIGGRRGATAGAVVGGIAGAARAQQQRDAALYRQQQQMQYQQQQMEMERQRLASERQRLEAERRRQSRQ